MSTAGEFDSGNFRKALGSFTTGVTVVTTKAENGTDIGLTANSFNSVSLDPPMVLWSLGKTSASLSAFENAEHFAVHILAEDQQSLSGQFATKGIDKFAGVELERGPSDIPLLKKNAARFVCKSEFKYEGGDHIIFVGRVIEFDQSEVAPLLFHSGQYAQLSKKQGAVEDFGQDFLGYLLARCYQQLLVPLKKDLTVRGLNIVQYYLITLVAQFEGKTLEQIMDVLALGDTVPTAVDIDQLKANGIIAIDNTSRVTLTDSGQQLNMELASVFKAAEADAENDLSYDQRQNLKLTLRQLIKTTDPGAPKSWVK